MYGLIGSEKEKEIKTSKKFFCFSQTKLFLHYEVKLPFFDNMPIKTVGNKKETSTISGYKSFDLTKTFLHAGSH